MLSLNWRLCMCALVVLPLLTMTGRLLAQAPTNSVRTHDRVRPSAATPQVYWRVRTQQVGKIAVSLNNAGFVEWPNWLGGDNCEREWTPGVTYPKGSWDQFNGYTFWFGGVKNGDTLVTSSRDWIRMGVQFNEVSELWGVPGELQDQFTERTSREKFYRGPTCSDLIFDPRAISEHDVISTSIDTITDPAYVDANPYDQRRHKPLGIKLTRSSFAWSYEYAEDFVLVHYKLENVGYREPYGAEAAGRITGLSIGVLTWWGIGWLNPNLGNQTLFRGGADDYLGRQLTAAMPGRSGLETEFNMLWVTDNDGDPGPDGFDAYSVPHGCGIRLLAPDLSDALWSFNWWTDRSPLATGLDWGPVRVGSKVQFLRSNLGWPETDRGKYQLMTNGENDYPPIETAISHESSGWLPPPSNALDIADGVSPWGLLSFGPYDLDLGDTVSFDLAIVGGENVHPYPAHFQQTFDPYRPDVYMQGLDFSDLIQNAQWAGWMYDTPGVDTDGDGYRGKYQVVDLDTIYYEGDGVPDYTGPPPPPAPSLTADFREGTIFLRWNGRSSETTLDPFLNRRDFEGYRAYMSRTGRNDDWLLLAQRDLVNYARYTWNPARDRWLLRDPPFTRDSLKALYDTLSLTTYGYPFEPDSFKIERLDRAFLEIVFDPERPDRVDSLYHYFAPFDANETVDDAGLAAAAEAGMGVFGKIRKLYPAADTAEVRTRQDGTTFAPYYEYEYAITDLQVAEPVFLAVTAFDHGDPISGLKPLESAQDANKLDLWPINSAEVVNTERPKPGVYPNPYRISDYYNAAGWENPRGLEPDPERARKVTFTNVPDTCTVSIWSIDGDLVRELEHRADPSSSEASVVIWNLITRNTQAVKTGIYIWSIESRFGTDVGRLVIVK